MATRGTLVIGGNGKTGRRVAERLAALGRPVRIGSRSGDPPFDWTRPATWKPALAGMRSAYITYQPDLAFTGATGRVRDFANLAVASGVRRLVLLSGRNELGALRGEWAVQESGAEWTIVRSSFLNQNFDESFWLEPVLAGTLSFPAGQAREPFIDAGDIADIVVDALTTERHVGEAYEVTGPRLLGFTEALAEISEAAGRVVRYEPVSAEEYAHGLRQSGVPAADVDSYSELFGSVLDGRNAYVSDGVRRALGREPLDFREYARRAAASGVWDPIRGRGEAISA